MKKIFAVLMFVQFFVVSEVQSQTSDSSRWNISADLNTYFFEGDIFLLPVIRADRDKLHLETRYNYEDFKTFSAWAGYNFSGGNKLEYAITPMFGGVTGNSKGIATGLEVTLAIDKFEFYSESEYFMDLNSNENNFFYTWTDMTYSFSDRFWAGLSIQRTKLYKTNLDIQRGLLIGTSWKKFEATAYAFNMGFDTTFFILTLSANF